MADLPHAESQGSADDSTGDVIDDGDRAGTFTGGLAGQWHPDAVSQGVRISRIELFPLKSFPGVRVASAELLPRGPLQHDRRWAVYDAQGQLVNGKRHPRLHGINLRFSADLQNVLWTEHPLEWTPESAESSEQLACVRSFAWPAEQSSVAALISERLGFQVQIREDNELGFPDDTASAGPTLIGSATLHEVASWFPGLSFEECQRRFRANIILETPTPFWEDRLFGSPNRPRLLRLGGVELWGINPCQRCAVPARDSRTGEATPGFQKEFARRREESLPPWADRLQFNHYYRLAVNTRLASSQPGQTLAVGDLLAWRE